MISITVEAVQIAKEGDVGLGEGAARIVIAGASGAIGAGVGGAIAKVGTTVVRSAVSGAVGGAVASATAETGSQINQAITGNGFDGGEVVEAAKTGAVVGGVVGGVTAAAAAKTDLPAVAAQAADRTKTAIVTTGESIGDIARDAAQEAGTLDDDKRR